MKNTFIMFIIIVALTTASCGKCADGWKHAYDSETPEQVDAQQVTWNYYLLFPMFRYIPEHGTA